MTQTITDHHVERLLIPRITAPCLRLLMAGLLGYLSSLLPSSLSGKSSALKKKGIAKSRTNFSRGLEDLKNASEHSVQFN
jgi:hypothetical protein